ncbi:V-type proton ATPase subunit [Musa troglodytarum]|uniref:V-type proton ATPase subunit n=1 Tax=Musa troglodytarum TaxID=320322 RepID=A0A9E7K506_9LILI|nr:V-type proton ATPase subunit [Musa troglodytarum]
MYTSIEKGKIGKKGAFTRTEALAERELDRRGRGGQRNVVGEGAEELLQRGIGGGGGGGGKAGQGRGSGARLAARSRTPGKRGGGARGRPAGRQRSSARTTNRCISFPTHIDPWPLACIKVMDPVRGHGGIHTLLAAEQEAQQIVSSARNCTFFLVILVNSQSVLFFFSKSLSRFFYAVKTGRLKQAKDEAEREAAAYRAALEEDYQRKVSESTGSSGWNVKRLEKETETKIQNLKNASSAIHADVINMLLKHVTTVQT